MNWFNQLTICITASDQRRLHSGLFRLPRDFSWGYHPKRESLNSERISKVESHIVQCITYTNIHVCPSNNDENVKSPNAKPKLQRRNSTNF